MKNKLKTIAYIAIFLVLLDVIPIAMTFSTRDGQPQLFMKSAFISIEWFLLAFFVLSCVAVFFQKWLSQPRIQKMVGTIFGVMGLLVAFLKIFVWH